MPRMIRFRGDELLIASFVAALTACPSSPRQVSFPAGPSALTARGANEAVLLTWTPVAGATSYFVYRSTAPGARAAPENVQAVPDPGQTWHIEGVLANWQTYYFAVSAAKDGAETLASPEASATPRDGAIVCMTFRPAGMTDTSVAVTGLLVGEEPEPNGPAETWFEFLCGGDPVEIPASETGKKFYGSGEHVSLVGYEVSGAMSGLAGDTGCWYQLRAHTVLADCAGSALGVRTPRTPEVVASALDGPAGLVLGADTVYFAERGADRVAKVAKSGGAVETVSPAAAPAAIAGGDGMLYVIETGGIVSIDPATAASAAVSAGNIGTNPSHLVLAGSFLYWRSDEAIWAAVAGGSPSSVTGSPAQGFATDGSSLYWSDASSIWAAPLSPGSDQTKLASCTYCGGVVLESGWLYFYDAGAIYRVPASGGARELLVGVPASWPGVTDATDLYWIDTTSLQIKKAPLAGGPVTTLAYSGGVDGFAYDLMSVDATYVYWIAASGATPPNGAVLRTPKD
jgi:hypothetical protein